MAANINAGLKNVIGLGGRFNLGRATTTTSKVGETPAVTSSETTTAAAALFQAAAVKAAVAGQTVVAANASKLGMLVQTEVVKKFDPGILTINPNIITALLDKTTTQLARGAMQQLNSVGTAVRDEAINTIKNRHLNPNGLMNYLERRVKVGEVLNELSKDWEAQTQQDFAEAFGMDTSKLSVMDAIVSLAILNDPELEDELRLENLGDTSETSLLENRRIVWQYPPPGTPLDPPYVVLVAVEHQDLAKAQQVIDEIIGQLTVQEGFKVPKPALLFRPITATMLPNVIMRQPLQ